MSRYARPIKLCLITKQQKSELFGLKENYLKAPKFINVRLANDMNEEKLIAYREMKLVYSATKGLTGVSAKLRGASVIIDERVYGKADFDRLPHGLTAESISTRLTPDGVAFQSHLSPLSNLYTCKLTDQQGRTATSVEHIMYTPSYVGSGLRRGVRRGGGRGVLAPPPPKLTPAGLN